MRIAFVYVDLRALGGVDLLVYTLLHVYVDLRALSGVGPLVYTPLHV